MNVHPTSSQMAADWFYFDGASAVGPFSWATLQQLRQGGLISDATQVCCSGDKESRPLGKLAGWDTVVGTPEELMLGMLTSSNIPEPGLVYAPEQPVQF